MSAGLTIETLGTHPDPARLGGKGAALSRLVAEGFRVPSGFVVSTDAFEETIEHLALRPAVEAIDEALANDRPADGSAVRRRLRGGRLPTTLARTIATEASALGLSQPGVSLILRSSATVEDGEQFSFAGIFESTPIDASEALEPTILDIWASLFAPRSLAYLSESGLHAVPSMAIVVQRFLDATRAGVMFTDFPAPDSKRRVLIEHVEGGCEKLVKGEVTPERVWLPRFGTSGEDVGLLGPGHATALVKVAQQLEELFGVPQDVEWVIANNVVNVVQTRPITHTLQAPLAGGEMDPKEHQPLLTGVPASRGAATGGAHLVFNIEQAEQVSRGQVLVTPMTNPDMVVAMRRSSAVVTDVGGIICHAAIVSRELGLPCVVGTERATKTLGAGQVVTVDGGTGHVYDGRVGMESPAGTRRSIEWTDVWEGWSASRTRGVTSVPVVPCLGALEDVPTEVSEVVLVPDIDLRCDERGLWQDLEALATESRERLIADYVRSLSVTAHRAGLARVTITPLDTSLIQDFRQAIDDSGEDGLLVGEGHPDGTPLVSAATVSEGNPQSRLGGPDVAVEAAVDTLRFFGHSPTGRAAAMPRLDARRQWWQYLPEYARFHREFGTEREQGTYEWLEIRPELVISPLLKSLVQPGFEMVPRILGFKGLPPMHVKWIRCRYHFRADVFARVWEAIARATWNLAWLAALLRRIRISYQTLEDVLTLFPGTEEELRSISNDRAVAVVTAWWQRWVEFFALCWFIQAQGDDVLYPFVQETVADNLSRLDPPTRVGEWPTAEELIAPLTPVMSAEYMMDLAQLGADLREGGFRDPAIAEAALARGEVPELSSRVREHLARWHWMRDRDLFFEPWDTEALVLAKALSSSPPRAARYEENRRRNLMALAFHVDLARASGRAGALAAAARFFHDLNIERENHHVLWLKFSYRLRRLVVELGRRLAKASDLEPSDVFFLQAPELLSATRNLPGTPAPVLVACVKNRRAAFLQKAALAAPERTHPLEEDDYY